MTTLPKTLDPQTVSTVYGPVLSWRVGWSLGIDLICETSVCSFNCVYCQLGQIQQHTLERQLYVSTEKLMADLAQSDWKKSDIITFSGSGEPTLALNVGEGIREVKAFTRKPTLVLTNGTTLSDSGVRQDISCSDKVFVKLDAASEPIFQRINRPVDGISLSRILEWTKQFRTEYDGHLGIQCMFLPLNLKEVDTLAGLLLDIQPDEVQLNTPKRPYPDDWYLPARGSHGKVPYTAKPLKVISAVQADEAERRLREKTGLDIVSVYENPAPPIDSPLQEI